eukprot:gb/GEZN01001663.1/.p1 GENE.gb/GEZN01001663.1/~~gb/GEZN01001663.1/.p1  ORF type:complete len:836 (-),score=116.50 gb/GEZN01001663.1/:387-2528(-)
MLLCDGCEDEYHMHCLKPKLNHVPRTKWYCPNCQPFRALGQAKQDQQRGKKQKKPGLGKREKGQKATKPGWALQYLLEQPQTGELRCLRLQPPDMHCILEQIWTPPTGTLQSSSSSSKFCSPTTTTTVSVAAAASGATTSATSSSSVAQALMQLRASCKTLEKAGFELLYRPSRGSGSRKKGRPPKYGEIPVLLPRLLWRQKVRLAGKGRRFVKLLQLPKFAPSALLEPSSASRSTLSRRRDMDDTKSFKQTSYMARPGAQPVFRVMQLLRSQQQRSSSRRGLSKAPPKTSYRSSSSLWRELQQLFPAKVLVRPRTAFASASTGVPMPSLPASIPRTVPMMEVTLFSAQGVNIAEAALAAEAAALRAEDLGIVVRSAIPDAGWLPAQEALAEAVLRKSRRRTEYRARQQRGKGTCKLIVFEGDALAEEDAEEFFDEDNPYSCREHSHSHHRLHPDYPAVQNFLEYGFAVLGEDRALSAPQVAACEERVLQRYNHVILTVKARDLARELEIGWETFKLRNLGRYDMVIDEFLSDEEYSFLHKDAPWLPAVKLLLGDDCRCVHTGCMLSLPGSETQPWHSDGPHLSSTKHLPPHAVNVFLPLVDLHRLVGPTEFVPTSHITWTTKAKPVIPCPKAGQALLFDYRLKHRGLGNRTNDTIRPLIYITYGTASWKDPYNFSRKRYKPLPPLIDLSRRGTREERLAKRQKLLQEGKSES